MSENVLHHCRCFRINLNHIENCRIILGQIGFKEPITQTKNIDRVFGYVARLTDKLQIHLKVMKDGTIEGKLEPHEIRDSYHHPTHSYSAHKEIEIILRDINIQFHITPTIPDMCNAPRMIGPNRELHASTMRDLGVLGMLGGKLVRESYQQG